MESWREGGREADMFLKATGFAFWRRRRSHYGQRLPFWYFKRLNAEEVLRDGRRKRGRNIANEGIDFGEDSAAMSYMSASFGILNTQV